MTKLQIKVNFLLFEKVHSIELNKGVLVYILCFSYVVIELRLLSHSIDKHCFERRSNSQLGNLLRLFTFFGTQLCRFDIPSGYYLFAFRNIYIVPHLIVLFIIFLSFLIGYIASLLFYKFCTYCHTTCAFITVIWKRFGDAGLGALLLESGVIGSGSLTGVFEGKHYNRALRLLKIVSEAFERLRWEAFGSWLNSNDENKFLDPNFQHLLCQS